MSHLLGISQSVSRSLRKLIQIHYNSPTFVTKYPSMRSKFDISRPYNIKNRAGNIKHYKSITYDSWLSYISINTATMAADSIQNGVLASARWIVSFLNQFQFHEFLQLDFNFWGTEGKIVNIIQICGGGDQFIPSATDIDLDDVLTEANQINNLANSYELTGA